MAQVPSEWNFPYRIRSPDPLDSKSSSLLLHPSSVITPHVNHDIQSSVPLPTSPNPAAEPSSEPTSIVPSSAPSLDSERAATSPDPVRTDSERAAIPRDPVRTNSECAAAPSILPNERSRSERASRPRRTTKFAPLPPVPALTPPAPLAPPVVQPPVFSKGWIVPIPAQVLTQNVQLLPRHGRTAQLTHEETLRFSR